MPHSRPWRPRISTALVRVGLYYLICWSIIALLWPPDVPGGRWWVAGLAVLTTAPIISFVTRGGWNRYPTAMFRLFVVRPVLYIQLLLPLVSAAGVIGLGLGALVGTPLAGGRIAAATVLGALIVLFLIGYVGTRRLVVRSIDATIPTLPLEFDGLRIAQISDLHIGPQTSKRFLADVDRTIAALAPDLIAVTGDLIDDQAEDVAHYAAGLGALDAPLGVYLIPGNHDVYAGWPAVEQRLRDALGATVLVNEARVLARGDARIALVGTGDPAGRRSSDGDVAPDIDRALAGAPSDTVVIALAHNPALWPALAERGVALTLSGHTHWGQFALPRLGWSLASPFLSRAMGVHESDGALLYIHPGTGYWGIPFRVGASPEVALITLRAGATAAVRMSAARAA
jgi:predicted MPP superfamily phosphohydrolase